MIGLHKDIKRGPQLGTYVFVFSPDLLLHNQTVH